MIGDEHDLAVAWHQSMHGAKEHCRSHSDPYNTRVAAGDLPEAVSNILLQPALDADQCLHALV